MKIRLCFEVELNTGYLGHHVVQQNETFKLDNIVVTLLQEGNSKEGNYNVFYQAVNNSFFNPSVQRKVNKSSKALASTIIILV